MDGMSLEAFRIVLFLLPGLVTLQVRNMLIVPTRVSLTDTVIFSAVLTFIDHVLAGVLPRLSWLESLQTGVGQDSEFWKIFVAQGGLSLLIYSASLGLVLGFFRYRGWDYALLRGLRLTRRSGYEDVWNETFTRDRGSWLIVSLKDGRRLRGWASTYSDEAGTHELFLGQAAWVDDRGALTPIAGPGILLTRVSEITAVEFWKPLPKEPER